MKKSESTNKDQILCLMDVATEFTREVEKRLDAIQRKLAEVDLRETPIEAAQDDS